MTRQAKRSELRRQTKDCRERTTANTRAGREPSLIEHVRQLPAIDAETVALCRSETVCIVADAFVPVRRRAVIDWNDKSVRVGIEDYDRLAGALYRLEEQTRTSKLRKVKP